MAFYILPYDKTEFVEHGNSKPPRGTEIRRDVPILESKAVNERRKAERAAAGVTSAPSIRFVLGDERLQDPLYYASMGVNSNLGWDEL
jgi:hypothetical protein